MDGNHDIASASPTRLSLFEDRYGVGATERLLALLRQPCISFAEIASRFGVTRERVRQWHHQLLPDAPTGRARRRLCRQSRQRHQLVKDPLFRGLINHVREDLSGSRLTPIPRRSGYRKSGARLDGQLIALKRARRRHTATSTERVYTLPRAPREAAFVYFELSSGDFLFVPRMALPENGGTFVDDASAVYARYKNTFTALRERAAVHAASG